MNLLSKSQQTVRTSADLIIDIRSGSVGACLVSSDGETPEIHWSDRFAVDFLSEHDTDRLLHMTKEALSRAVAAVQDKGLPSLKDEEKDKSLNSIYCYFAAPWQIGSPEEITIQNDTRFEVNEDRLELAKEKAEEMFLENAINRFGTSKDNLVSLTTALLACWCNGYRLESPLSVSTQKLRASTYVSMLPQRVRSVTENTISKTFHPGHISYHSFTAAIHRAFTQSFSHPKTFLVINIDEEMTQLLIINSGILMGSVSYPIGSHFLIRQLAKSLEVPASDARARLRQYQENEAVDTKQEEIGGIIRDTRQKWQNSLVTSLGEFSADISIPEYAFVLASHDASPTFKDFASGLDVDKHLLRTDSFRVHEVTDDLLEIHAKTHEKHSDHYLSIASIIHTDARADIAHS